MNNDHGKQFAQSISRMYLTHSMAARGWVAGAWPVRQNGRHRYLPCLEQVGGCAVLMEGELSRVINKFCAHEVTFADVREAVPFAEAWAAWSEAQ